MHKLLQNTVVNGTTAAAAAAVAAVVGNGIDEDKYGHLICIGQLLM